MEGLRAPAAVAVGGSSVAVADTGNGRVVVVDLAGVVLGELGGLETPTAVRSDGTGRILVAERGAGRVLRIGGDGERTTVIEGVDPVGVAAAADGGTFVVDARGSAIHVVRPDGSILLLCGGEVGLVDGPRGQGRLHRPAAIALGPLGGFVADAWNHAVRVVDGRGGIATLVGRGSAGLADGLPQVARLREPMGVACAPDGSSVYVADTGNDALRFWSGVDGELSTLPVDGLSRPTGIDVLPDGRLVVADTGNDRVVLVDLATGALDVLLG